MDTATNSCANWQTNLDSVSLWNGAMSAEGSEVVVRGQGTWLSRETPSPHLNIRYQSSTVALSWLVSTRNFMLQQKTDLADNWVTVPITPSLILTNLQQEITIPATGSNAFFRLSAQ